MGGVTFHGFDEIRNQVVASLELHINVGPGIVSANSQLDQVVVHPDQQERDDNQYTQNDPGHNFSSSSEVWNQGTVTQSTNVRNC